MMGAHRLSEKSKESRKIIKEHQTTDPLTLSDRDIRMIRTKVNDGRTRLGVKFTHDGLVKIDASSYVGIIALPDGPTIEIRPKFDQINLLYLLRYATGVSSETFEPTTNIMQGPNFIEALGTLFDSELQQLLRRGIRSKYRQKSSEEQYLRGTLDVTKQLRNSQTTAATSFHCSFDEHTPDMVLNQAVLYAATVLANIITDQRLSRRLNRKAKQLRKRVTLRRVDSSELQKVEMSRFTSKYTDIIRLTEMILTSSYIEDYTAGTNPTFSLLVNMNTVFERSIEQAFRHVASSHQGYISQSQRQIGDLLNSDKYSVNVKPDIVIKSRDGRVVCVADAKWKAGNPENSDFYQLAAYQQVAECPGVLVYPEQSTIAEFRSELPDRTESSIVTVCINNRESYETFCNKLTLDIESYFTSTLGVTNSSHSN
jgi:5-methylcytosine-specific restriction enzyme subunit McrC